MLKTPLGRFRLTGIVEGISYILLLVVAMPLKYFADLPMAVTIVGGIHGALFILYILTLAHVYFADKWSFNQGLIALIASVIPLATFYLDAQLKRHQKPVLFANKN
jgi:integral membrane protein